MLLPELLVSLNPMVRGPGPWSCRAGTDLGARPLRDDRRVVGGNAAELIQALTVMLPVSCRPVGLPRFTKSSLPSRLTAVPYLPTLQVAPPVSVPVRPCPEASAAVVPAPSSKAYPAARPDGPPGAVGDGHGHGRRRGGVAGGVAGPRAQAVRAVGRGGRVPGDRVGGGRVLRAEVGPSSRNWTPATPTLSAAFAVTVVVAETVAPAAGRSPRRSGWRLPCPCRGRP